MQMVVNKHKAIMRFGFMHMIAVNIYTWIATTVKIAQHEFLATSDHSSTTTEHSYAYEGSVESTVETYDSEDYNSSSNSTDGELIVASMSIWSVLIE